jgi:hypothetical protein
LDTAARLQAGRTHILAPHTEAAAAAAARKKNKSRHCPLPQLDTTPSSSTSAIAQRSGGMDFDEQLVVIFLLVAPLFQLGIF